MGSGWADRRVISKDKRDNYMKTVKALRSPLWNLTEAADYLQAWLRGDGHAAATATPPTALPFLQRQGTAQTGLPLESGGAYQPDFAMKPPKPLVVADKRPVLADRGRGRGRGGRRGGGRAGRGRAGLLSDMSGLSALDSATDIDAMASTSGTE